MSNNDLPRRNGDAVMETLRRMDERVVVALVQVAALQATVSELSRRLQNAETSVNFLRAVQAGTGPTER